MNTSPFSTSLRSRLARAGIVIGGLVVAAVGGVAVSPDFRSAIGDLVGDDTITTIIVLAVGAALTQLAGHLAGKATTKSP